MNDDPDFTGLSPEEILRRDLESYEYSRIVPYTGYSDDPDNQLQEAGTS